MARTISAMPINASEIERLIKQGIPDAKVEITDLAGDNNHYAAVVISSEFTGKSKLQQHQLVYKALGETMGGALHALQLQTSPPNK
jgi:stress-induced morphogen